MKLPISVTIITKNEAHNIERCLRSVAWADDIVIIDSGSTDKTIEICKDFGARVFSVEWHGFGKTKQEAVNRAKYGWIFSIDADEEVTPALAGRIREIIESSSSLSGYRVKRRSRYLDKWISHSGWDKDYPLRLFNKKQGNFNDKPVHESVEVTGKTGRIEELILHYTYPSIESHIQKINRYTSLAAGSSHKKVTVFGALFRGFVKFIRMYFLKMGILDGKNGLVLAINSAIGVFIKYIKIWEKGRTE